MRPEVLPPSIYGSVEDVALERSASVFPVPTVNVLFRPKTSTVVGVP